MSWTDPAGGHDPAGSEAARGRQMVPPRGRPCFRTPATLTGEMTGSKLVVETQELVFFFCDCGTVLLCLVHERLTAEWCVMR